MTDQFRQKRRNYTKTNFVELLEIITPNVYTQEDQDLSGLELNPFSDIINSHIRAASIIASVTPVSSITGTITENLNTFSGISKYFVKQNELTHIVPYRFEEKILIPLGTSFKDYSTSAEFYDYVSGTLCPLLYPATNTSVNLEANMPTLSALTADSAASSAHVYLTDELGWYYFLNFSSAVLTLNPSSLVARDFVKLYTGDTLETVDGVKLFTEYIWKNYQNISLWRNNDLIIDNFVSGAADAILDASDGVVATYTSGTQKLDNLLTLVDAVYSKLYIDKFDFRVKEAFEDYSNSEVYLTDEVSQGPLRKFQTMMGLAMADYTDAVENLGLIYDVNNVKEEHLQYIADLIGWKLRGNNTDKWRHQLRTAVEIYKKAGTLESIQIALNNLVTETVLDVSGRATELWESYLPFLVWYALATESPLFKDLKTWDINVSKKAGIAAYSLSSLEENIKLVVDNIFLKLYKKYPDNFIFGNSRWEPPRLFKLDSFGHLSDLYTIYREDKMKPFHCYRFGEPIYYAKEQEARNRGQLPLFQASLSYGPLGYGVYAEGSGPEVYGAGTPSYLSATGDLSFVFNYRGKTHYPVPPFEEVKYFRDCTISEELVDDLVEQLKCLVVDEDFADQLGSYVKNLAISDSTSLRALNEFLILTTSAQVAPNYNEVLLNGSNYQKNVLPLWNGKSSHLFIDFDDVDFDFDKITLEGDSPYAFYEASRIAREFAPAHAITRVNLNTSSEDFAYDYSAVNWDYTGVDKEDDRSLYSSGAVIANFESSGAKMRFLTGGGDSGGLDWEDGRGGLSTFKRDKVDNILDTLAFSSISTENLTSNVNRRALRRRNYKYTLPKNGYYDRTGFNAPVSYDPSVLEESLGSSLGELTLGYIPSAGRFYPVVDPIDPTGVWHRCENLDSSRSFSGVDTSATFPYRGLSSVALNNNIKIPELSPSSTKYVDRGQLPYIYKIMHSISMDKARSYANDTIKNDASAYDGDRYWKYNVESLANTYIDNGYVINSYDDYLNFEFGSNLHKLYRDYQQHFEHGLGAYYLDKTGANIFAHTYGDGIYNCNFEIDGSAVSSTEGAYVASSLTTSIPISHNAGSGVFSLCAVENGYASGTYIASSNGDMAVPLFGTFVEGSAFHAEYRNPHILSGIEFVSTSGASDGNEFRLFRIDPTLASSVTDSKLVNNLLIKAKSVNGLPRLRFDLSSYGDFSNFLIKDHKFKLSIKALVGDESSKILGGRKLGVWIHTNTLGDDRYLWTWNNVGKWELHKESDISRDFVLSKCYIYQFPTELIQEPQCLKNQLKEYSDFNLKISNLLDSYFKNIEIEFDTRNFTQSNNFEYLDIIPVPDEYFKLNSDVHRTKDTNYIIEIFLIPDNLKDSGKYLLIDSIGLTDLTLSSWAGTPLGFGTTTNGTPLRPFVEEDVSYLDKEDLRHVLKFYNGLAGQEVGIYNSDIASRDATITATKLEQSGGSRLNYRINPEWVGTRSTSDNKLYTDLEIEN